MDGLVPPQEDSEESVESYEVIHVGMGYKDMGDSQYLARRQRCNIAEIKEYGASIEEKIDKNRRISAGAIHKAWMKLWLHGSSFRLEPYL